MEALQIHERFSATGLRTKFFPKSRISQGLIALGPWLNVVLLMMFFAFVLSRTVVQPGYVVQLPSARFADGVRPLLTAVVLVGDRDAEGNREEVVFLEDVRLEIGKERQMERFRQALAGRLARQANLDLTILADGRVRYGTLVQMLNLAQDVGVKRVNLAFRESDGSTAGKSFP